MHFLAPVEPEPGGDKGGIGPYPCAMTRNHPLHLVTWLAPGIPLALFEAVRGHLADALGVAVTLESREKLSGPAFGATDPFGDGRADLGFMCAPACVPVARRVAAGFDLLGLAPLFDDPRSGGRPLCFCDLVVREDCPAADLEALRGGTFGYNDTVSLSGWLGLSTHLAARGATPETFFGHLEQCGGHLRSLDALRAGAIDVASIDSNVLRTHPGSLRGLRVLESVGPWPSQPVVVRRSIDPAVRADVKAALGRCGPWPDLGFTGFRAQAPSDLAGVPVSAAEQGNACG